MSGEGWKPRPATKIAVFAAVMALFALPAGTGGAVLGYFLSAVLVFWLLTSIVMWFFK